MSRLIVAKAVAANGSLRLLEVSNRACAIEVLKSSEGESVTTVSEDTNGLGLVCATGAGRKGLVLLRGVSSGVSTGVGPTLL